MMQTMLANGPLARGALHRGGERGLRSAARPTRSTLEATAFGLLAATDDKREGTRAFLEKRAAKLHGRVSVAATARLAHLAVRDFRNLAHVELYAAG